MSMEPYLRESPTMTLSTLMDKLESTPGETVRAATNTVKVDLGAGEMGEVIIGERHMPMTASGMEALCGWTEVPKPFLMRQSSPLQEHILNYILERNGDDGLFRVTDTGLLEVRTPGQKVIEPRTIIEIMQRKVDKEAEVVDFWSSTDDFRLDTIVPTDFDRGIGGDKKVDDITRGGCRVTQNRKLNHAPQISEFYYRLICTNGMEVQAVDLTIDARGQSVDEVLMEIEMAAQRIMGRVEDRIKAFYEMRKSTVRPHEQLLALQRDGVLPTRAVTHIMERLPSIMDDDGNATEFDLINLVTNEANSPTASNRAGSRLVLERAGGGLVYDHSERCVTCRAKLN